MVCSLGTCVAKEYLSCEEMKSIKKKLKGHKGLSPRLSQSTPLINNDPPSPDYQTTVAVAHGRRYQSVSSIPEDANENELDVENNQNQRPRYFSYPSQASSPINETSFGAMNKKEEPSWVKEARQQSLKEPVMNIKNTMFSFVEISKEESWLSGIWQASIILFLFLVLPSVIFMIAGLILLRCYIIPNAGRSMREKNKVKVFLYVLIASIFVSVIKDSIIAMSIVRNLFNLQTSIYDIIYAGVLLLLLLIFVIVPGIVYVLSGVTFSYGNNVATSSSGKPESNKGMRLANEFMKNNLMSLHEVTSLKEQGALLVNNLPRILIFGAIGIFFVVCAFRNFAPWLLRYSFERPTSYTSTRVTNGTLGNMTNKNTTSTKALRDTVMVISGINAFFVSFALSFVFVVVTAWSMTILKMWRSFLYTDNTKSDLISNGVDGIVAWWRVYQTLSFFTTSRGCPIGILRVFLQVLFAVLILVTSIFLLIRHSFEGFHQTTAWFMIIDNALMILGLLVIFSIAQSVTKIKRGLLRELSLKRLDMATQAGAVNPEAEKNEGEYHVHLKRFKIRNLRASFQLLQELYLVLKEVESDADSSVGTVLFYAAIVLVGFAAIGKTMYEII